MKRDLTPAHCRDDWAGIDSAWSPVEMTRCWAVGKLGSGSLELLEAGSLASHIMLVEVRHYLGRYHS